MNLSDDIVINILYSGMVILKTKFTLWDFTSIWKCNQTLESTVFSTTLKVIGWHPTYMHIHGSWDSQEQMSPSSMGIILILFFLFNRFLFMQKLKYIQIQIHTVHIKKFLRTIIDTLPHIVYSFQCFTCKMIKLQNDWLEE